MILMLRFNSIQNNGIPTNNMGKSKILRPLLSDKGSEPAQDIRPDWLGLECCRCITSSCDYLDSLLTAAASDECDISFKVRIKLTVPRTG